MTTPSPLFYIILSRPNGSNTWTQEEYVQAPLGNFFSTKSAAVAWVVGLQRLKLKSWIESEQRHVPIEYTIGEVVLTLSDTNVGNTKH